ncbi:unnamed protein product [Orchesella dallaii]|uniref:M-phase inducer phosphatase n=1 Tax=Orchesella dallaii TaxID=48710 RepID=A0ABP1R564_9HEXA
MISRKPFADRNEIAVSQKDVSPEKKKETHHFELNGRTVSADSGFVSPETICRPKLSASRRSSPATGSQPFTSFRLEDSTESCHVAESQLPSLSIADLWNKPLKLSEPISTKVPRIHKLCSDQSNTPIRRSDLPPTKLSFDSCESSSDESPPANANLSRKAVGYRRSLSYHEPESCKKEPFRIVTTDGTPVFNPKRHKYENDENSPYKTYLEKSIFPVQEDKVEAGETRNTDRTSSLTPEVKRLCFARSQSESALTPTCSIKKALERIESNPNLIGDGSKSYALPFKLIGKHQDLKEITGETLADLLEGKLQHAVTSFKVIDCRYPYEYDGGHIKGAINLFTRKQIYEEFIQTKNGFQGGYTEERNIVIFHCEFSSQRGPDMCRYLRDTDRDSNAASYPCLYYPEMYVLFGGYKAFFEQYPALCVPETYLPMDHPNHLEDCRRFKSRTKSEYPLTHNDRFKKSKSQNKLPRTMSFAKKCNF